MPEKLLEDGLPEILTWRWLVEEKYGGSREAVDKAIIEETLPARAYDVIAPNHVTQIRQNHVLKELVHAVHRLIDRIDMIGAP